MEGGKNILIKPSSKKINTYKNNNEPIVGIDLGTTYSYAAIMRNNKVDIIPDEGTGKKLIPSIVSFRNDECLIGTTAKNNFFENPESTMFESKRLIGHKYSNSYTKNWPVKVIEEEKTGKPQYVIKIGNEEKKYYPEEVSSMILEYIKKYAEAYENKKIKQAIITVPAHFNKLQRDTTIEAGKKAGFENIKLINEPTAAAIAYGDIIKSKEERKILIFDLGGGTFDVSIVKIKGNEYYVLASIGEEHLGGEDFNQRIIEYVMEEIKKKEEFKKIDFNNKEDKKIIKIIKKLKIKAEEVKIELSSQKNASFFIEDLYEMNDFKLEITREKYEKLCMDLWNKCIEKVDETIEKAKLKKEEIDEIILVGGSTRTPKIREMVQKCFNGKEPLKTINADEVVANGAVLSAYLEVKINDMISKSIGVLIEGRKIDYIISKDTSIPLRNNNYLVYKKKYKLNNSKNSKKQIIKIYEGDNSEQILNNKVLGEFSIELGKEKEIEFTISMIPKYNSVLNVKITYIIDNKIKEYSNDLKYNQ